MSSGDGSGPVVVPGDAGLVPGTPPPGQANTTLVETGVGDMAARATFLALFIILGFVGNSVVITTIAQSRRLRGSVLNLFIISVAAVNLVDCIINMPLILGSTISAKWDYGSAVCSFNAFTIQTSSMGMVLGLSLMAFDRFLAVYFEARYQSLLTIQRALILTTCSWVYTIAFSVPLVTSAIPVQPFSARYLCAIGNGASLIYICIKSLFGYLIPSFVTVGFFIVIIKTGVVEMLKENPQAQDCASDLVEERRIWTEINASKYVGVLSILWCIFQGPYLLLSFIEQCRNSDKLRYTSAGQVLQFTYPWELDLGFTWMKLSYPVFLPLVTFFWRKEVWQKFKNRILCRKSNLIKDASPHASPEHQKQEGSHVEAPQKKKDLYASTNTSVPVLFATENGLHLETYRNGVKENDLDHEINSSSEVADSTRFGTARKCDVYGSQELLQLDDDTSDYDSHGEVDPFSNSNPISVRTEYDKRSSRASLDQSAKLSSRQRSSSVGQRDRTNQGLSEGDLKLSAGDSGSNTQEKKKRNRQNNANKIESSNDVHGMNDREVEDMTDHQKGDRTSNDSGRGSVEGNSVTKRLHKRPRIDTSGCDVSGEQTVVASELSNTACGGKKEKGKKKKKNKYGDYDETRPANNTNNEHGEVSYVNEIKRPPARLKPIDAQYTRPLPELKVEKSEHLQAPNYRGTRTGQKDPEIRAHHRTSSSQSVSSNSRNELKKPQTAGSKEDSKVADFEAETKGTNLQTWNTKPKRDRHARTSTSDSEAALLSSNNSTDLSEVQDYAVQVVEQSESSMGKDSVGPVPRPRKTKRRSAEIPKGESKTHLIDTQMSCP